MALLAVLPIRGMSMATRKCSKVTFLLAWNLGIPVITEEQFLQMTAE